MGQIFEALNFQWVIARSPTGDAAISILRGFETTRLLRFARNEI
jgi:hypothetical protein